MAFILCLYLYNYPMNTTIQLLHTQEKNTLSILLYLFLKVI